MTEYTTVALLRENTTSSLFEGVLSNVFRSEIGLAPEGLGPHTYASARACGVENRWGGDY